MRKRFMLLVSALGVLGFLGILAPAASAQSVCLTLKVSVDPVGTLVEQELCIPGDLPPPPVPIPPLPIP